MTDKYTREEKVKRLLELLKPTTDVHYPHFDDSMAIEWLNAAEERGSNFTSRYAGQADNKPYMTIVRLTWDVHTGVAFTKLYKAIC